jgi:peptidoglycan/LPS O-acetylase OafA/YrhL
VQFYLLAPFIAYVFAIRNAWVRRIVILLIIVTFAALHDHSPLPVTTLFEFLHFFLLGFLLADLYVSEVRLSLGNGAALVAGLPIFAGLLFIEFGGSLGLTLLYLGLIFSFYYMVLTTASWQWCFSRLPITVIGGMCYSIYLLHFAIIAFVGKITLKLRVTDYYVPNLLMQALLILPIVLIACGLYFYLIEKPCMSKDWYIRLYRKFFGKRALATGPALGETPVSLHSDSAASIDGRESTRGGSGKITSRIE